MTDRPDFSIVIVNINAAKLLRACLDSIEATRADITVQTIVVDNGSTDASLSMLQSEYPNVVSLPQGRNIGYVPANNIGMRSATGRYMMYLNNDTELRPGCLQALAAFLDANPRVGAISGKIMNPDGSDQGVARRFPSLMNGLFGRRSVLTKWFPNNPWAARYMLCLHRPDDQPFEVDILSAACMVVRTDQVKSMGGFDEAFTLYWVDAELCGRLKRAGYTIWCVPKAGIMHYEGKGGSTSTLRRRVRMTIAFNRDAYLAYWKYKGYGPLHPLRWIAAAVLTARTAVLLVLQLLRPGKATSSGAGGVNAGVERARG